MSVLSKLKQLFKKKPPRSDIPKRFELMGKTGQGSMSKVFRARDRNLGRTVCLKILDKEKTAKFEARFQGLKRPTEGEICISLRHKNIVRTHEHGLTMNYEQFVVMELIEGVGLNYLIETHSNRLDGNRINFLIQITDALEYTHQQRYIHRDICPRNVMVTNENVVKLIDFGLTVPYLPQFCKPGNRTGSSDYLAPEIIKRTTTDHRVDLFALGVTAYEIITNNLPWERTRSLETIQSHLNMSGRGPLDFRKDLDPHVVRFLVKAIDRDPKLRFQTAADFREAMRKLPKQDY